jgi:signal transduction histidine kinase
MNDDKESCWRWDLYKSLSQLVANLWLFFGLFYLVSLWLYYQIPVDSQWSIRFASLKLHQFDPTCLSIIINSILVTVVVEQELTASFKEENNVFQEVYIQGASFVLDDFVQHIALALSAKVCCIYVLHQKRQELVPVSLWCVPDHPTNFTHQTVGEGVVGLAAQSPDQNVLRVDDLRTDSRFKSREQCLPYKSILALPLMRWDGKQPIGVLMVADKNGSPAFLPEDEQQLLVIAHQNDLGLALQNLLLDQKEEQWVKKLSTINQVCQAFTDSPLLMDVKSACQAVLAQPYLKDLFEFDIAEICLWDAESKTLTTTLCWPEMSDHSDRTYQLNEGYTGWIARNQYTLRIDNIHQQLEITPKTEINNFPYHSYLGTPLKMNARFMGTLELAAYSPNVFNQKDATILEIVAAQAAVVIGNAQTYQRQILEREQASRLFEREKRRRQLVDTLRRVAEAISSQLEFDDLLNIILQGLGDVVDYTDANVQLLQGNRLVIIGGRGWKDSQKIIGLSFPMDGDNPNRHVVETQEPVMVSNIQKEYAASFASPLYSHIKSWLGVPLTYGTNILGLMALGKDEEDFYTQEEADVVLAFANQVAVAVQNARLFEEAREQVRQLATLTEVAQSINRALELTVVLDLVLDAVFDLVGQSKGSIWLIDSDTDTVKIADTRNVPDFLVDLFNESDISIDSEPFASAIKSGRVLIIEGSAETDDIANYGLPFPDDVTYVPLKTEEGVIGILAIEVAIHNKNMVELVTTLADLAAVAIENARLVQRLNMLTAELEHRVVHRTEELARTLQDLTEERDRVRALYQIARELSSSFDLDRILNETLHLINRAIGISYGEILLIDSETKYLICRAALGRYRSLPHGGLQTKYKVGYGLAGKVMETHRPRLIPDLTLDEDWISTKEDDERRSAIVVPLGTGDEVSGALLLFSPDANYFTEDHLKLVSAASAQITTTVNNVELYRLITDQAERLGVMYRSQTTEAAKNQAILKGITDGVLVLDANRDIVLINPKTAEILNFDASTLENQPLPQILGRSESPVELKLTQMLYDNLLEALVEIEAGETSAQFRLEAGRKVVMVALAPVVLGADEPGSIVAVLRDISKEAEIERLKNEFISTVSHELRTPMTSIKGYADLLLSSRAQIGELNPMQHRFVEVIQSNADRLTELVNDILEISHIETGRIKLKFESLDIIKIIKDVTVSFEGQMVKKVLDFSFSLPDHLPAVYADKARLTQVLVNLLGNAWQYTPEGGKITVSAKVVDDLVQVDVEDSGVGIVEEDLKYIFDRFFRSERTEVQVFDGTGLGLSITKSFVDMLGGQIWVKSQIEVGSTFSFTVPLDTGQ